MRRIVMSRGQVSNKPKQLLTFAAGDFAAGSGRSSAVGWFGKHISVNQLVAAGVATSELYRAAQNS
jgi:hypothetical protein